MRVLLRVAAVALVLAFVGCQSTQTSETGAGSAINANCAMKDSQPIDAACTIDYKGKKIGFCCNNCKRKFEGLSDTEKEERILNLPR